MMLAQSQHTPHILIVDDDPSVGLVLKAQLVQAGYRASLCASVAAARSVLTNTAVDLVLSDLRMPEHDGMALLHELRRDYPELPLVMLTAHGTVANAVAAMREGASDFLLKPFDRREVLGTLARVLASCSARLDSTPPEPLRNEASIGVSSAHRALQERIEKAAAGRASVLIHGEAGTGKQRCAQLIHQRSRNPQPMVLIELGSLPQPLIEETLFGRSDADGKGKLQLAHGSTLLLKDVDALPAASQARLYQHLQAAQVSPRMIATTRVDLMARVRSGLFRDDLYYALSLLPIWVSPLRERRADISALVRHFLAQIAALHKVPQPRLDDGAMRALEHYDWPGNVRELVSFIERLTILHAGKQLDGGAVEGELAQRARVGETPKPSAEGELPALESMVKDTERTLIAQALDKARGNRTLAARLLGVSRRTLYNKLAALGIGEAEES